MSPQGMDDNCLIILIEDLFENLWNCFLENFCHLKFLGFSRFSPPTFLARDSLSALSDQLDRSTNFLDIGH